MPKRMHCPKYFSKRSCHQKYMLLRNNLRRLAIHLRAQGHCATVVKGSLYQLLGVRDEEGSLHICSKDYEVSRYLRRCKKKVKPFYPLFVRWQEKRLVLLKGKPQWRSGLRHLR